MPMALGAKIVAPVPKKPDPIAAFERGNHTPDDFGRVTVVFVDLGRAEGDWTAFDSRYDEELKGMRDRGLRERQSWVKGDWGPMPGIPAIPIGETKEMFGRSPTYEEAKEIAYRGLPWQPHEDILSEARKAVSAAIDRGVDKERIRDVLRTFGAERMTELDERVAARFTCEISALSGNTAAGKATESRPFQAAAVKALSSDEVATPRQNAIAAKMAEVQRQKQELRALVRKDTKR